MKDHVEYRKVSARWVPRLLTADHKRHRWELCQSIKQEGNTFLDKIVTCDEMVPLDYTSESKQISIVWRNSDERAARLLVAEVMVTVLLSEGCYSSQFSP